MLYVGIDPGYSGAVVKMSEDHSVEWMGLSQPEPDISRFMTENYGPGICLIEKVWAYKGQGVSSAFTFGSSFGFCVGTACAVSGMKTLLITPQSWQSMMGLIADNKRGKEKKRMLRDHAETMFTGVTNSNADALLLAECARRIHEKLQEDKIRLDELQPLSIVKYEKKRGNGSWKLTFRSGLRGRGSRKK